MGRGCGSTSTDPRSSPSRIDSPTLVCVGELDTVTAVDASREILDGLPPRVGQLAVIPGAGHFPWLDAPDAWPVVETFGANLRLISFPGRHRPDTRC